MTLAKSRSPLVVLAFLLPPLLFQGCLSTTRYRANPKIHIGTHVDIWSFSDAEINSEEVDELFLKVARLMDIVPYESTPRPQVLIVSPTYIRHKHLSIHPSAKARAGVAAALYIPQKAQILIPHFDRTLLTHELAHYFTYHYVSASRSSWEWIAEKTVNNERVIRRRDRTQKPDSGPSSTRSPHQSANEQTTDAEF
jgi:hypothetical protein